MTSDRCPPAPVHALSHVHTEHCTHCGSERMIERKYELRDRLMRALFVALCRAKGLDPRGSGRKNSSTVYVQSKDPALLDRLWARYCELAPDLDDELLTVAARFIEARCGLKVPIQPRE